MRRGALIGLMVLGCGGGTAFEGEADSGSVLPDAFDARVDAFDARVDAHDVDVPEISVGPLALPLDLVGVGSAVGDGVLGPVYPLGVWSGADQIVVVGLARAAFSWGDRTYPSGGFVLAIDPSTRGVRWHRKIGESVNAIASVGDDLVIVGVFSREITLEPATPPITLKAPGKAAIGSPSDGFVALVTKSGTFRWARRFGSTGYDQAFGVAATSDAIVVAGNISGVADLGEGCSGLLEASSGGDDGDGRPSGVMDGVVLRYGLDGACPWGAVFGAPATNELAMGVAVRGDAILVTGESGLPLRLRTTTGVDRDLAGGTSTGTTPFLLELDAKLGKSSTWLFKGAGGGGRGRSLAMRGSELLWGVAVPGDAQLTHDGLPVSPITAGAHVLSLRDGVLERISDFGASTTDIGSLATTDTAVLAAATASDPGGVVLARIDPSSLGLARHRAAVGMPFASTAVGKDVWIAGYSGTELTLGEPPTKIAVGPQGGFFLLRGRL